MPKMKILVIEDENDLANLLKLKLERNDYEVDIAFDGREGFEKARSQNPDLIVLDLMLPEMDGLWICDLLKKDKKYSKIPIIITTARSENADMALGKKCGADAYIIKPFNIDELMAKIEELL